MNYALGSRLRFACTFTHGGVPADPTTVRLSLRSRRSTVQHTPTRTGVGTYEHTVALDVSGRWYWAWVGEGDVPARVEGTINIRGDESL
jgi:hypothetical protein